MALFQQSSITVQQAKQIVADSANASADTNMLARATKALDMATERWNNYHLWHFLLAVPSDIAVVAPISITGCAVTSGSATVATTANPSALGVLVDDIVSLSGFAPNSTVTAVATASFGVSIVASASVNPGTATCYRPDYDLPTDFAYMYDAQLLTNSEPLRNANQRQYTRVDPDQVPGVPTHYTLYPMGARGKIRLSPPPSGADVLKLRYYRRLTLPSALATASALDIHRDFEFGLIALAKYYFLLDKGGPGERIQGWQVEGERVLREARAKENQYADGSPSFVPDMVSPWPTNPNDISPYLDW